MDMQVVCLTKLKLSPTLVVVLLVSFTVVIAAGKDQEQCSQWCDHGECLHGQCLCEPCWSGHKCQRFDDLHKPRFVAKHSKIYISKEHVNWKKPIFTVKARDHDGLTCKPDKRCSCAEIIYKPTSPSELFVVNSSSGEVYVTEPSKLQADKTYSLWVTALPNGTIPLEEANFDQFRLEVVVQEVLGRIKRQVSRKKSKTAEVTAKNMESFATSFSLRTVGGEVNTLQVGSSIHYRLEIALPRASVDLLLEIYTKDSHSGNKSAPALSLYNFTIPHRVSGISFTTPEAQYFLSNKSRNVFDRLSVDFGSIKNTGPDRNVLTIYFSVVLTRKPGKSETKHAVTIGAEYGKGTFVWVAQSQITTASLSQSEDQVHSNVEFSQLPSKVDMDNAAIFQMVANLEFRSDHFRMEISKPSFEYEPDNLVSLGRVSVSKFGRNYQAIPNNSSHYISHRENSASLLSFSKSVLDMGVITNIGEKGRSFGNNADNIIHFSFAVYALNYKENVGKNSTFMVRLYLGNRNIWSKTMNLTIGERKQERSTARMLISTGEFSTYNITKGGLTQLLIRSEFAEADGFVDYALLVEVPHSQRSALFVPCAAKFLNEKSGFNMPYLSAASIKPVQDSGQFLFTFGRIHFVAQRNAHSTEDNTVAVEITFRVPFHSELEDGTTLFANVKAFSGSKSMKVLIPHHEVTVYSENITGQVEVNSNRSVVWEDFVIGGGIGFNLNIEFAPNMAFSEFQIKVHKDDQLANLPQLNICKVSLVKVGMDLPCTCVQTDSINQNSTKYSSSVTNSSFHDQANIDLGSISVLNLDSESYRRKLVANVAMMIRDTANEPELYPILVDVLANNEIIWSERINFTVGRAESQTEAVRNMSARLNLRLFDSGSITPGFTTNVLLEVITAPNTMGPLTVEVISEDEELSVCGLWIDHIGDNMPCINKEEKANYNSVVYGQNNVAKLHFDAITNFGSTIRRSESEEQRANTLQFIAMVRVSEAAKSNKTIKVILTHGQRGVKLDRELIIPVNGTDKLSSDFKKPKHFSMRAADENNVTYAAIGKLIYFDIELEQNSQVPITVLIEPSNDYKICNSAFVKIGTNYPCYSASSLKISPGKFELGMICNTFLNKDSFNDNLLRLAVALRPNSNLLTERTFKVSSLAYVGSTPLSNKHELVMSVASNYSAEGQQVTKGATVHAEVADNVPIRIRQRKWVPFNVRIPPFSTSQLTLHLQGDADEARAVLLLHDLKIISGGSNIACPLDNTNFKLIFNSSVSTTQNNMITTNLGYFSNFGFSHTMVKGMTNESEKMQDDFLKMQVLAELSDHPAIAEDSLFKISITTHFGDPINPIIRQGQVKLVPIIGGEPSPKIDVNIKLKKKMEVLDRGDTFTMTAFLKHLPESASEPINPILRLFTPDFIEVIRVDSASTTELPTLMNSSAGTTDILFPWILFSDEIVVNFTIQIDPNNIRGYGREEANLITPYRVMCEHFRSDSSSKSPCSQLKHLNFFTKSSECNWPLGMESGDIADWQISASSAISQDFAPTNARPNSAKFWSPVIRNGRTEYLQIDFARKTRVVRLSYRSIRGLRRVASFHLLYSNDARVWRTVANRSHITFNGEEGQSIIKRPVEARFYRFVIDEIEASSKGRNQYVSVRLELYGCKLEEQVSNSTNQTSEWITHFSDDPTAVNRHIAVDEYTNVIYVCDATIEGHQMCYYSANGGQSWNIIGRSIDSVEGFELATGKFFAIDYQRPAYFSSTNGFIWTPIHYEQFNATVSHSKFRKKIMVPQFHLEDIRKMDIRKGNWRVNYDGLYYDDSHIPKAYWKNCCGLD